MQNNPTIGYKSPSMPHKTPHTKNEWLETSFSIHDTNVILHNRHKVTNCGEPYWKLYREILNLLKIKGFTVTKDPRIEKDYPILSASHDAGSWHELKFCSHAYTTGCKFEFFQDLNVVNSNGGRYDFDKLGKMPYLVRLRFVATLNSILSLLSGVGSTRDAKVRGPNPDPLAFFNSSWSEGRFKRDETGWPDESELKYWSRNDLDGKTVNHGDIRYCRDRKGYLRRGEVYGGINGMWMMVYGPGRRDHTHLHIRELFTYDSAKHNFKEHPHRRAVIDRLLQQAVKVEDFERATILKRQRDTACTQGQIWTKTGNTIEKTDNTDNYQKQK